MKGARLIATVLALILLMAPGVAHSAEKVKVAVFPFAVFSRTAMPEIAGNLQKEVGQKLAAEGINVIEPKLVNQALQKTGKPLDLTLARRLAGDLGADYAVYGSMTYLGTRVSLDAKVMDVLGMSRPQTAFVEGMGLDELGELSGRLVLALSAHMSGLARVAEIRFKGNKRIESEAIKETLSTKEGGAYSPLRLDKDLRTVWKMGYFSDVRLATEDGPAGKIVTFTVKEKPMVREVGVSGNEALDTKDIQDQIGVKPFTVYKPSAIKEAESKILKLYRDKGYYDAKVAAKVVDLPSGDKGVRFEISEGAKLFISRIRFLGNKAFDDGDLKKQMETGESGVFSWFTDSNILDRVKLEQDKEKLHDFYYNRGYMTSRISAPEISRDEDGLVVTFNIVEGPRFKVSSVSIGGDLVVGQKKLVEGIKTQAGEWFSRENLRNDIRVIHDIHANQGFAYVTVRPRVKEDRAKSTVAIALDVKKGAKVYFENIVIVGNHHTRDNVIRRELRVAEGDLFSSTALRHGNMRLHRLGFFEDVHITTKKGSTPGKMDIRVNVKEKRTGSFSVGAGYSSVDSFMVMGSVTETNLMGRGQTLRFSGQLGGKSTRYNLSFTEPWLFDRPISFGLDLYNWFREYNSYDKEAQGVRFRFGFPLPYAYTRIYTFYKYEDAKISNVADNASLIIRDQVGWHTTSSLKLLVQRDSRNHNWNPTQGSDNSISIEYAGGILQGTNAFTKIVADSSWYLNMWLDHVFVIHGRLGLVQENEDEGLPIYERFFLGGINSLRGFDWHQVGPRDPETGDVIGGHHMALFNLEYRFPLVKKSGIVGVVFYDAGNAWLEEDGWGLDDLRSDVGVGIRWYSPMGPLRLEYGWVIDPEEDEETSQWQFTIGGSF